MKKAITLVLVLMMVLSLAACGGSTEPEAPAEPAAPAAEPAAPAAEPAAEPAEAGDWNDFADIFTLCFYGVTEGGETVAFVLNDDETLAALAVVDTETMESVSFVGAMEPATFEDGTTGYTITDEANGLSLSFSCEFFDDGSVALDLGDYGAMAIMGCEQSEAFDLLNAIDASTTAIA